MTYEMCNPINIIIYPDEKSVKILRKICTEEGCIKNARHGYNKCVSHGGGKRCSQEGCTKSAQGKTDKCKGHGGGKRCSQQGCITSAYGNSDKCMKHGGGLKCTQEGCTKSVQGKTDKCKGHGGGSRCSIEGCIKGAYGSTNKCKRHGGGPRCSESGCTKSAFDKSGYCKGHGGGNRCIYDSCKKSANGNTNLCIEHGGGKRCPNCINWIDSHSGQNKYDGYCARCFKIKFPNDKRSKWIYIKSKEIRVRNEINTHFEGFIHDMPIYIGCDCAHKRRVDHRKLIGNTLLCIETDEFAHVGYDPKDEESRYNDLYMIHGGKMIFIRFNPDGKRYTTEYKMNALIDEIRKQIQRIKNEENTELLEIIKMFY